MKKILSLLSVLFLTFGCYDDSDIRNELRDHEERLAKLETLCKQMNTNISALQTIVSTLQKNVFVTAVTPIKEGSDIVGYAISFSNSESVTIYHGRDGVDGEDGTDGADGVNGTTPSIGVRQDTDGIYYWTLDGEWLLDATGKKVQAVGRDGSDGAAGEDGSAGSDGEDGKDGMDGKDGADGKTPQLKIESGYWYVSYDGGKTWEEEPLGQATGDKGYTMFAEVTYDEEYLYITMADGEKLVLPRTSESQDEGEEQEGMSQVGPVKIRLSSVTPTTATFTGSIDASDEALDYIKVMVRYSRPDIFSAVDEKLPSIVATKPDFNEDKTFSITLLNLDFAAEYKYCIIVQQKNDKKYSEVSSFATPPLSVELDVKSNTQTTVQFKGKVDPTTAVDEAEIAVLINTSETVTKSNYLKKYTLTSEDIKEDGSFDVSMSGLKFGTTYYYTYYVLNNYAYSYGTIQTFKTEDVPITIEVESIDKNVVTFKGNVQFSEAGVIEIGVQYYPKSTTSQSAGIQTKAITEISENGDFTVEISGLLSDTEYCWQYYLLQNDVTIVGLLQTFEIADLYNVQSYLNMSSASDLSSSASANCYIISESGLYKFKTVKGNSSESVGSVASASILWETFGTSTSPDHLELIDGVCYKGDYIAFKTADTFKEGNAVIAAKDADGNILWSWHIWLTDHPHAHVYNNNAGTMMDRNLGATSATPGDVVALGLLYQWGRKDPFLGSSSISDEVEAKSTIAWPSTVSSNSSNGTIEYATAHPTTFITCISTNTGWYYTGSSSTDNTRWTTSSNDKSIYDPCPAGWRVPDGGSSGVWSKALGSSATIYDYPYDSTNEGMNLSGKFGSDQTIWYPASGFRSNYDGSLSSVGYYAYYWSASPSSYYAYNLYFNNGGGVNPSSNYNSASGQSVRCLQE